MLLNTKVLPERTLVEVEQTVERCEFLRLLEQQYAKLTPEQKDAWLWSAGVQMMKVLKK